MAKKNDTKGKPVSDDAIPMHKKMAMGQTPKVGSSPKIPA